MSMKACDNVNCTKILLTISNLREEKHNQPYSKLQTLRYPDSVLAFTKSLLVLLQYLYSILYHYNRAYAPLYHHHHLTPQNTITTINEDIDIVANQLRKMQKTKFINMVVELKEKEYNNELIVRSLF